MKLVRINKDGSMNDLEIKLKKIQFYHNFLKNLYQKEMVIFVNFINGVMMEIILYVMDGMMVMDLKQT